MNIVFVTTEYVSEGNFGGGLASYLNNISAILADSGNKITVITASDRNESLEWKQNIVVKRVYISPKKLDTPYHWKKCIIYSYLLNKRLKQMLKKGEKIDIVQYTNYCALALFRTKLPSVVRISSDMLLWRNANIEGFDLSKRYNSEKLGDYLEDIALKRADTIYGPSKLLAEIIGRRTHKKIEIIESPFIQNGVKTIEEVPSPDLKGKEYLLTASALNRMKGVQVIAEAIYRILDCNPDLYYVLAGENRDIRIGEKKMKSVEYIIEEAGEYGDRVLYLGVVPRGELYSIIKQAKAVVLPSRIDNLPNSCIEAMYLEKVIIGTRDASYEQLIEDGYSGYLIERDSADSLVQAVEKIMQSSEDDLKKMGMRARERTNEMSPEIIRQRTLDIYWRTRKKYK